MGKKRIVKQKGQRVDQSLKSRALSRLPKKKLTKGTLNVQATYNNTLVTFSDEKGNTLISSSSGSLGFKGAKKGTPFAAAEVGKVVGEKAAMIGVKEVEVIVKGVGSGRESSIRSFAANGIEIIRIQDKTPIPHNGPRPRKARRV